MLKVYRIYSIPSTPPPLPPFFFTAVSRQDRCKGNLKKKEKKVQTVKPWLTSDAQILSLPHESVALFEPPLSSVLSSVL